MSAERRPWGSTWRPGLAATACRPGPTRGPLSIVNCLVTEPIPNMVSAVDTSRDRPSTREGHSLWRSARSCHLSADPHVTSPTSRLAATVWPDHAVQLRDVDRRRRRNSTSAAGSADVDRPAVAGGVLVLATGHRLQRPLPLQAVLVETRRCMWALATGDTITAAGVCETIPEPARRILLARASGLGRADLSDVRPMPGEMSKPFFDPIRVWCSSVSGVVRGKAREG